MIDIDKYIEAIKITWIKRLKDNNFSNWKIIPKYHLNKFGNDFSIFDMRLKSVNSLEDFKQIPEFYLEIIKTWIKYKNTEKHIPLNYSNIRQQIIWGNQDIMLKGKSLLFKNWIKSNIMYMNDIIDKDGHISEKVILSKLENKTNWISEIVKLRQAIPKKWIDVLKSNDSKQSTVRIGSQTKIYNQKLSKLNTKDIYNKLKHVNYETPIGFSKWIRILCDENIKLKAKYTLNFIHTCLLENKHKLVRWKLLHYILPNQSLLQQWKISQNGHCKFCHCIEDYEHFFIKCRYLNNFWEKIYLISKNLGIGKHVFELKCLIWGYKIQYPAYNDLNLLISIILFSIYKANYVSEQKTKNICVYTLFVKEFKNFLFIYKTVKNGESYFLSNLVKKL